MKHPDIYSQDYYQRIFDLEEHHWWHCGMREIAAGLIWSESNDQNLRRVLDAGCGTGATMAWLGATIRAEEIVGIDISENALRFCRKRPDLVLAQATVMHLPFSSESFDLIVCMDVIQHLPVDGGDLAAMCEMYRVLRAGGYLLLRTNSRLGMWQKKEERDADFQRFTVSEVVSRLRGAGFEVRIATYANALMSVYGSLKQFAGHRVQRSRQRKSQRLYEGLQIDGAILKRGWLNRALLLLLRVEAVYLSGRNRRLPFGHTIFCLARKI